MPVYIHSFPPCCMRSVVVNDLVGIWFMLAVHWSMIFGVIMSACVPLRLNASLNVAAVNSRLFARREQYSSLNKTATVSQNVNKVMKEFR